MAKCKSMNMENPSKKKIIYQYYLRISSKIIYVAI